MDHRTRCSILLAVLLLGAGVDGTSALRPARDENGLRLTIKTDSVQGSDAMLDFGSIRHDFSRTRNGATLVTRRFSVRADRTSGESGGTATLRAFLATPDPHCTVRIDGIALGTSPIAIDCLLVIGRETAHRLDFEISPDAPQGTLLTSIEWELTTD